MKLLVIGSGMMGSAAAYDMARTAQVGSVTLADSDLHRAREVAARVNRMTGERKVRPVALDASKEKAAVNLMRGHDAALSAVPYRLNVGLARAAVEARCHFADLGGNNTVVRQELALSSKAEKRDVALAPDCGLSPGMATILGGELVRRLGGRADALSATRRLMGYQDGLAVAGIPFDPDLVREGDYTQARGRAAARELLDRPDRPTAIFAANDKTALGVMDVAPELGLRIPHDLSLVGFDNLPDATQIHPQLTTVDQSIQEMGYLATKMLVSILQGEELESTLCKVPTRLIIRESCQAPSH